MSLRVAILFADGKASPILRSQCVQKGALEPLLTLPLLETDRSATTYFRRWWQAAFPDRDRLPFGPLAEADGRGTVAFWDVFAK
jgi:hypothetical protein